MAVSKSVIPDAELNILKVLWDEAPLTVREIARRTYREVDASSLGTVQKLIARLEEKGMLSRDKSGPSHSFSPLVDREEIAGLQLAEFARKLSGGSLSPFLMHLVKTKKLSKKEREEIRELLDE